MAISTTTFESTLQTKLNNTSLEAKEMLLLGKALESTVGSIAVSDINTAGANKVSEINAVATNTFKTVGGTSILGSGDIATLPSQSGASGKVLKSDGTNAAWGTDEGGTLKKFTEHKWSTRTSLSNNGNFNVFHTFSYTKTNANCNVLFNGLIPGYQGSNGMATYHIKVDSGSWYFCGAHTYIANYGVSESLAIMLPDSAMSVGTHTISLSYSSNGGQPFNVMNPNGTDHSELQYAEGSIFHLSELAT